MKRKHISPKTPGSPKPRNPPFKPIAIRARHDGWNAERQAAFIDALAACGCVDEACSRVGMGRTSAYALRTRSDATSFRIAWDAALDVAIQCLEDAFFSRTINGTARPIFYKGEQVGERRYYNDRAAMFLLRYREPARYGKWRDHSVSQRAPDGAARSLAEAFHHMMEDATAGDLGVARPVRAPLTIHRTIDQQTWDDETRARNRHHQGGT